MHGGEGRRKVESGKLKAERRGRGEALNHKFEIRNGRM